MKEITKNIKKLIEEQPVFQSYEEMKKYYTTNESGVSIWTEKEVEEQIISSLYNEFNWAKINPFELYEDIKNKIFIKIGTVEQLNKFYILKGDMLEFYVGSENYFALMCEC